jgi:hypothetical protein
MNNELKNKPNSNPIKANTKPIQSQLKPIKCQNKPNTNPIYRGVASTNPISNVTLQKWGITSRNTLTGWGN